MPLLGVNNCQPIIHMSKILVYIYRTYKQVIKFSIGYMINPSLHINKVLREQVKTFLRAKFYENKMEKLGTKSINMQLVIWLTLHFTLTICSENKLKNS